MLSFIPSFHNHRHRGNSCFVPSFHAYFFIILLIGQSILDWVTIPTLIRLFDLYSYIDIICQGETAEIKHIRNRRSFHNNLRKMELNLEFEVILWKKHESIINVFGCSVFITIWIKQLNKNYNLLKLFATGFPSSRGCFTSR